MNVKEVCELHKHLRGLKLEDMNNVQPLILIGLKHAKFLIGLDHRYNDSSQIVASKTKLGWTVFGARTQSLGIVELNQECSEKIERIQFHRNEYESSDDESMKVAGKFRSLENLVVMSPKINLQIVDEPRAQEVPKSILDQQPCATLNEDPPKPSKSTKIPPSLIQEIKIRETERCTSEFHEQVDAIKNTTYVDDSSNDDKTAEDTVKQKKIDLKIFFNLIFSLIATMLVVLLFTCLTYPDIHNDTLTDITKLSPRWGASQHQPGHHLDFEHSKTITQPDHRNPIKEAENLINCCLLTHISIDHETVTTPNIVLSSEEIAEAGSNYKIYDFDEDKTNVELIKKENLKMKPRIYIKRLKTVDIYKEVSICEENGGECDESTNSNATPNIFAQKFRN